jgi:hypothetical protein
MAKWPRVCGLLGRLVVLGGLLYTVGGAAFGVARLAARAVSGGRPGPEQIAEPVRRIISHGRAALPAVAVGLLLMLLPGIVRFVQRRRAARGASENADSEDGTSESEREEP